MGEPQTVAALLRARAEDDHPGLLFADQALSWRQVVRESGERARLIERLRRRGRPFHIGVLMENTPEYLFLLGGAALAGATVVGVNPTRRGNELAHDIRHTDCAAILGERRQLELLDGLDTGVAPEHTLAVDDDSYTDLLAPHRGSPPPDRDVSRNPDTTFLLMFTSGSTGAPKAVVCSTGRLARYAYLNPYGLGHDDTTYCAMPLFHGNALMAAWGPTMSGGGTFALRRRFSASGFLPDVRRFGATFFNYVGRSLAYVLAQPEQPDEAHTRLRLGYGTEASARDREEFRRRYRCPVIEGYGSSEGGCAIRRSPDTPDAALGRPTPGQDVAIIDPDSGRECPRAHFDGNGRLLNAEAATGEIVNRAGAAMFEGYYRNPEATAARVAGGWFRTGDLGYRDTDGFFYFAGRGDDWIRVDGENFATAPVERILARMPGVLLTVVYPVPDARTGDQVMATVQPEHDAPPFAPEQFADFLATQGDLGTKWAPRYVRVTARVPVTATRKTDKPRLRRQRWDTGNTGDVVYVRTDDNTGYRAMTDADRARLRAEFVHNDRENLLASG